VIDAIHRRKMKMCLQLLLMMRMKPVTATGRQQPMMRNLLVSCR